MARSSTTSIVLVNARKEPTTILRLKGTIEHFTHAVLVYDPKQAYHQLECK